MTLIWWQIHLNHKSLKYILRIVYLKCHSSPPGANEFTFVGNFWIHGLCCWISQWPVLEESTGHWWIPREKDQWCGVDVSLKRLLNKQLSCQWFEMTWCLWHHFNVVKISAAWSDCVQMTKGVLKSSVLGSILFNILINDWCTFQIISDSFM